MLELLLSLPFVGFPAIDDVSKVFTKKMMHLRH